ncbi:MAG: hypothetical protein VR70_05965 [Rhodospirillaceae bacterium BRH_c57]|nr:MAG: hypothetical protein VR70_05965 [Rhodospirillaceae bacterium BRH_c57]
MVLHGYLTGLPRLGSGTGMPFSTACIAGLPGQRLVVVTVPGRERATNATAYGGHGALLRGQAARRRSGLGPYQPVSLGVRCSMAAMIWLYSASLQRSVPTRKKVAGTEAPAEFREETPSKLDVPTGDPVTAAEAAEVVACAVRPAEALPVWA